MNMTWKKNQLSFNVDFWKENPNLEIHFTGLGYLQMS